MIAKYLNINFKSDQDKFFKKSYYDLWLFYDFLLFYDFEKEKTKRKKNKNKNKNKQTNKPEGLF